METRSFAIAQIYGNLGAWPLPQEGPSNEGNHTKQVPGTVGDFKAHGHFSE